MLVAYTREENLNRIDRPGHEINPQPSPWSIPLPAEQAVVRLTDNRKATVRHIILGV